MINNTVYLIGRLTSDPNITTTQSDIKVASFSLAVQKPRRKNEENSEADFFEVEAWRSTAEYIGKYAQKGSKVVVMGYLKTDRYEDKDGNPRKSTKVVCDSIEIMNFKQANTEKEDTASVTVDDDGDDLPF